MKLIDTDGWLCVVVVTLTERTQGDADAVMLNAVMAFCMRLFNASEQFRAAWCVDLSGFALALAHVCPLWIRCFAHSAAVVHAVRLQLQFARCGVRALSRRPILVSLRALFFSVV